MISFTLFLQCSNYQGQRTQHGKLTRLWQTFLQHFSFWTGQSQALLWTLHARKHTNDLTEKTLNTKKANQTEVAQHCVKLVCSKFSSDILRIAPFLVRLIQINGEVIFAKVQATWSWALMFDFTINEWSTFRTIFTFQISGWSCSCCFSLSVRLATLARKTVKSWYYTQQWEGQKIGLTRDKSGVSYVS